MLKYINVPAEFLAIINLLLTPNETLLLSMIRSLSKDSPCNATNKYFAEILNISKQSVSNAIKKLSDLGFIFCSISQADGNERELKIHPHLSYPIRVDLYTLYKRTYIPIQVELYRAIQVELYTLYNPAYRHNNIIDNKESDNNIYNLSEGDDDKNFEKNIEKNAGQEKPTIPPKDQNEKDKKEKGAGGRIKKNQIPDLNNVFDYATEKGYSKEAAQSFFDTQTAAGWKYNDEPIANWQRFFDGYVKQLHLQQQPEIPKAASTDIDWNARAGYKII